MGRARADLLRLPFRHIGGGVAKFAQSYQRQHCARRLGGGPGRELTPWTAFRRFAGRGDGGRI